MSENEQSKFAKELAQWLPKESPPVPASPQPVTDAELQLLIDSYQFVPSRSLSLHQHGVLNALRELQQRRKDP